MFFTNMARIVAIITFLFGALSVVLGFAVALEFLGPYETAAARYGRSGPMIDKGIYTVLSAIALGTLAEMSFGLRKRFDSLD